MGALMIDSDGPGGTATALTKELLDSFMQSSLGALSPTLIIASSYSKSVFSVIATAETEAWDWRRTKRELRRIGLKRKGVRRPYHKRALDG
jgi:hypothetical protein